MLGTYGSALEARKIGASAGSLRATARGNIELDGSVLVIRRIHVTMRLQTTSDNRAVAERVYQVYADQCPIYRTLKTSIQITSELVLDVIKS